MIADGLTTAELLTITEELLAAARERYPGDRREARPYAAAAIAALVGLKSGPLWESAWQLTQSPDREPPEGAEALQAELGEAIDQVGEALAHVLRLADRYDQLWKEEE